MQLIQYREVQSRHLRVGCRTTIAGADDDPTATTRVHHPGYARRLHAVPGLLRIDTGVLLRSSLSQCHGWVHFDFAIVRLAKATESFAAITLLTQRIDYGDSRTTDGGGMVKCQELH